MNSPITNLEYLKCPNDLEYLLDQVDGFFIQIIYDTHLKVYSFPYLSDKASSIYGIPFETVAKNPKSVYDCILDEDKEVFTNAALDSIEDLKKWQLEFRINKKKDGVHWLRINAMPQKLSENKYLWNGYITDITHAKKVEDELVRIKERFEFAIEGSKIGIWDWNLKEKTVFYSDRSLEMLEKKRKDIKPHEDTWTHQVHKDDREQYFNDIQEHFDGKTAYYSNHHRIFTSSGIYKWIQDRGRTVEWDENGKPVRVIGTHVDISKLKQHEQTILDKNRVINSHNNRLKNFALIVSHNLRTHTGNLKDLLRLIDEAETLDEKQELCNYLHSVSQGLSETVANLDDIVTANSKLVDHPKMILVQEYVNNVLRNLDTQIKEKDAVILSDIPKDIEIKYNAAYFESILHNLISNAIKYSHPDRVPKIVISVELVSENVMVLSVEDNGLGINLELNGKKLFGMYKTFHRNEDAKGLGLFMTKNQIEDMGDEITVESTLGKGSIFSVRFNNKLP